jgi:hypothetical protein
MIQREAAADWARGQLATGSQEEAQSQALSLIERFTSRLDDLSAEYLFRPADMAAWLTVFEQSSESKG